MCMYTLPGVAEDKENVGQFSYFVDILLCYTYIFRRQVLWGKDTRTERLLIVAKVKPASLLTVPSGILFPKSVSYNFDLSLFFPAQMFSEYHPCARQ